MKLTFKQFITVFLVACLPYLFMGAFKNTYRVLANLISAPKLATIGTDASVTAITVGNSGTTLTNAGILVNTGLIDGNGTSATSNNTMADTLEIVGGLEVVDVTASGTISDGTASLVGGALSGVTTLATTNNITMTKGTNADMRLYATDHADANRALFQFWHENTAGGIVGFNMKSEGSTHNLLFEDADGVDRMNINNGGLTGRNNNDADFDSTETIATRLEGGEYGMLIVRESTAGITGLFRIENQTIVIVSAEATFTITKDNAATYNVYYDTDNFYIQNRVGYNKNISCAFFGTIE